MYTIAHDLDLARASDIKQDLLAAIENHSGGPFELELSAESATQVSLQISFAAMKELSFQSIEAAPGPNLEKLVSLESATEQFAEASQ